MHAEFDTVWSEMPPGRNAGAAGSYSCSSAKHGHKGDSGSVISDMLARAGSQKEGTPSAFGRSIDQMGYPVSAATCGRRCWAVGRNRFIAPLFLPSAVAQYAIRVKNAHGYCALPHDKMRPATPNGFVLAKKPLGFFWSISAAVCNSIGNRDTVYLHEGCHERSTRWQRRAIRRRAVAIASGSKEHAGAIRQDHFAIVDLQNTVKQFVVRSCAILCEPVRVTA